MGLISASCRVANTQNKKGRQNIPEVYLGAFIDDYGSRYQISKTEWQHGAGAKYHLISYHQMDNYLIAQNDASITEAVNTAAADKTNPKKGCNGFPFSWMKTD